jgi:anthranilate phosphoribosyltransferase
VIREAIALLVSGQSLSQKEAAAVMEEIMAGQATPAQIASLVTALRMKGETPEEIAGMAQIMQERSLRVNVEGPLVDIVGTGGDGKGTFNISTAAALVTAAAGLRVAKHGNRAASGMCGSADLLEACGVKIDLGPEGVQRCIQETGIGFMFAPVFHPAMKNAAGPRREIGVRTVFNILGPLTNPARVQALVLGVPDPALGDKMAQVLRHLACRHALVVSGEDGIDELTLTGPSRVWELADGGVQTYTLAPEDVGLARVSLSALKGGSAQENRALLERLLTGEPGPLRDVVLLNAAAGLRVGGAASSLPEGLKAAARAIDTGAASKTLHHLAQLSMSLS